MGAPLLSLVQDVAIELGLPEPTDVIGSAENTSRQLGGLATRVGKFLLQAHDWTFLTFEWHITVPPPIITVGNLVQNSGAITNLPASVLASLLPGKMVVSATGLMTSTRLISLIGNSAGIDQPSTLTQTGATITFSTDTAPQPSDYDRAISRTHWDRSNRWELRGPQSPQQDQWVRSGIVATGPRRMYRPIGNAYRIWPPPSANDTPGQLDSEYISKNWAMSAAGTPQPRFLADTDTCVFGDDLLILGMKYLFFDIKGFDTTSLEQQFLAQLKQSIATDGPKPTLDLYRSAWPILITGANTPDSGFGMP